MNIRISFVMQKNFRSVFNENTDQFLFRKNFRFVFNENTDQFFDMQKISDLYLMKIQTSFIVVVFSLKKKKKLFLVVCCKF